MSILDIILALIILMGAIAGYKEGFIVSLFSLIAVILGIIGGFKLMGNLMVFLTLNFNVDEKVLPYLAFGLVFVAIVILVTIVGKFIKNSIDKTLLGWFDQSAGALLGIVRMTFMLSIGLWIFDALKIKFPEHWAENSWIHPMTASFAPKVTHWVGELVPIFRDVF